MSAFSLNVTRGAQRLRSSTLSTLETLISSPVIRTGSRRTRSRRRPLKESGETESRDLELLPASRITPRPTRWLWRDRLPLGGACLFAGQEGLGKTTIAVEIAARASRGQLEGDLYGEPCSIVYATAEDSWARTLRPRFEAANADFERVRFSSLI